MSPVRPMLRSDIPALVQLRKRSFAESAQPSEEALARYFETIFLDSPFRDPELPSLVYQDGPQVIGFLGVISRPMVFREMPVRVAVSTQLMVDPGRRGTPGVELLRAFLAGGQDLSFADTATTEASRLWERLGGALCPFPSLVWRRPLRPWRDAVGQRVRSLGGRVAARIARPAFDLADRRAVRTRMDPAHLPAPRARAAPFDASVVVRLSSNLEGGPALRPVYEPETLSWLLEQAGRRPIGTLQRRLVVSDSGREIGWYAYFANPGGLSEVLQAGAAAGQSGSVLDVLLQDAHAAGAVALEGRFDPLWSREIAARYCTMRFAGAWTVAHARRAELLETIASGKAMLSRLEGEWWLNF